MSSVLIIGAKSDIAKELAKVYAKNGFDLILVGREIDELENFKKDLELRYQKQVVLKDFDIVDFKSHKAFFDNLEIKPAGVIVVAGYMTEQKVCQDNWEKSLQTINVNFTGAVGILNIFASYFEEQKSGFIIGVSSVAGDRGRKTNYIYGSSKAGFSAYLSGLRNRLYDSNVSVLTVKPGFVDTKMTAHLELPPKLTATPQDVAQDIFNAQQKGKDILYTKRVWQIIMLVIKHIPEFIFKRLSI